MERLIIRPRSRWFVVQLVIGAAIGVAAIILAAAITGRSGATLALVITSAGLLLLQ